MRILKRARLGGYVGSTISLGLSYRHAPLVVVLATDAAAKELATELGYAKTAYRTKAGAAVFKRSAKDAVDGPDFISRDRTSHIGGVWKGANKKWENLNSDKSRSGTYDAVLKRIGD